MSENKTVYNVCTKCQNAEMQLHDDESVEYKCIKWLAENSTHDKNSEASEIDSLSVSDITEDTQSEISDAFNQNKIIDFNGQIVEVSENFTINLCLTRCKDVNIENLVTIHRPVQSNQKTCTIQSSASNKSILNKANKTVTGANRLSIVSRSNWLAQKHVGKINRLDGPVKLVIICHTATRSAFTQTDNSGLVRSFQSNHIQIKQYNDITYNFLVGCDGNIYEGRGWGVVGSHTPGYNDVAIGISFIGCFINHLPNEAVLNQAKALIKYGVEIGEIDENYVLVGHCQCFLTESPGSMLFQEIQSWDHWNNNVP